MIQLRIILISFRKKESEMKRFSVIVESMHKEASSILPISAKSFDEKYFRDLKPVRIQPTIPENDVAKAIPTGPKFFAKSMSRTVFTAKRTTATYIGYFVLSFE